MFFVISGYLITFTLITEKQATASVSFASVSLIGFYKRRIFRIAPATIFIILITVLLFLLIFIILFLIICFVFKLSIEVIFPITKINLAFFINSLRVVLKSYQLYTDTTPNKANKIKNNLLYLYKVKLFFNT